MVESNLGRDPHRSGGSRTLDNGLAVLAEVARAQAGISVSGLARRTGLDRTVVHRLVVTLAGRRMLRRRLDGGYEMGTGVLELAGAVRADLRAAAHEVLRDLADRLGLTMHLSVLDGEDVVSAVVVEPRGAVMHVGYRVGSRHPTDQGAAGLAILLGRPALRGERSDLASARIAGFAVTNDELQPGAWGLAAPVRVDACDPQPVTASVGVVAMDPLDRESIAPVVVEAAAAVARASGGR